MTAQDRHMNTGTDTDNRRHAYMIAVHKYPEQIGILLDLLDNEQNDLYIHIDSKSTDLRPETLQEYVRKGRIFFVDRISVEWARYSIVESTLIMLKAAVKNGPYAYYHLLSGQDLPLKPIEEINRYYDTNDPSWNYIELDNDEASWKKAYTRLNCWRFHRPGETERAGRFHAIERRICSFFCREKRYLQAGSAWFDINHGFAEAILAHEDWIRKNFYYSQFPDEAFLQTLVLKLGLEDTCRHFMRFIDWTTGPGRPRVFRECDYDRLIGSGMHFARKFDIKEDPAVIYRIQEYIKQQ